MRLKSLHTTVTNHRIKRTCVANIVTMLCLLSTEVCYSAKNIKQHRFARQLSTEQSVNYEDIAAERHSHHQPHFTGNRTVVVQLFEWKFVDIAAECRNFLGPQGYAGVQLSPVLEHTVVRNAEQHHPWWERYEVISYRLASRSGDEAEFWSMSRICNEHGVRIYADVVLNHMAAPLHFMDVPELGKEDFIVNTLLESNVNISQQNYSNVSFTQKDFRRPLCLVKNNAQDAHEIRNCQLNGHPDLDHSRGNVQKHIVKMLNKFVDMGVAGFRIDTAKYMWPIDLKNIFTKVKDLNTAFNFKKNARPFVYHDVFDLGLDTISKTEYSTYGVVSEYLYPAELSNILRGKVPLTSLINWGPALGFMQHEDSLVFIDSHDTQRGLPAALGKNVILTYKKRIKYIMANVFMLVHPYGAIKRIMSSFYFSESKINQGPPALESDEEEIRSPEFNEQKQCTRDSGWVCEHRWPELVNMLKVSRYFKMPRNKEESVIYFQTNGPYQVAFCRGYKAFVAINNDPVREFVKNVYACLDPGKYCDMVTGGKRDGEETCHGKILEINEKRYMKLQLSAADDEEGGNSEIEKTENVDAEEEEASSKIESYGIVVIYVESKIMTGSKNKEEDTSEALKGNAVSSMVERKQADGNEAMFSITTKEIKNENDEAEGGKNQSIENSEDVNNEDSGVENDVQKELEDEKSEEYITEQTKENYGEEDEEEKEEEEKEVEEEEEGELIGEENFPVVKNYSEEAVNLSTDRENEVEMVEEESLSEIENQNTAQDSAKDNVYNEGQEHVEEEQSIENQVPLKAEGGNRNSEKTVGEEVGNFQEDNNYTEEKESDLEEFKHSTETENQSESPTDVEQNHSRDDEIEEQIEKPSGDLVDHLDDASKAVTPKIQGIQTAGFFSNPHNNNG